LPASSAIDPVAELEIAIRRPASPAATARKTSAPASAASASTTSAAPTKASAAISLGSAAAERRRRYIAIIESGRRWSRATERITCRASAAWTECARSAEPNCVAPLRHDALAQTAVDQKRLISAGIIGTYFAGRNIILSERIIAILKQT
jgi:hypothetical protein